MHARTQTSMKEMTMQGMAIEDLLWSLYTTFDEAVIDSADPQKIAEFFRTRLQCQEDLNEIAERVRVLRGYRAQLKKLQEIPYVAQRTQEWYDLRKQRLTASDTAQAIGKGKFGTRDQLVQKKVNEALGIPDNFPKHLPALKWGIMFEAMAARCYTQRHCDMPLHEFGLLPHPTLPYYGASPDGITDMGIMIEIKCPYKRKITGEVPDYYELQIQGQMSVCGLKECDYVECEMQEFESTDDYILMVEDDCFRDHGVIVEFEKNGDPVYEYSEPYLNPKDALSTVTKYAVQRVKSEEGLCIKRVRPWRLRHINIVRVYFDEDRWTALAPQLKAFWDEVTFKREQGVQAPAVEQKTKRRKYEFIDDDD